MEIPPPINDSRVKIAATWIFILGIIGILESLTFIIGGLIIFVLTSGLFGLYIPLFILAIILGFPSLKLLEISRSIKNLEIDSYKRTFHRLGIFTVIFGTITWMTISFPGLVEDRNWELFKDIEAHLHISLIVLLVLSNIVVLRMLSSRKEIFTHESTAVYHGSPTIIKTIKWILILPLLLFLVLLFLGILVAMLYERPP